jgi:hypothetical protein
MSACAPQAAVVPIPETFLRLTLPDKICQPKRKLTGLSPLLFDVPHTNPLVECGTRLEKSSRPRAGTQRTQNIGRHTKCLKSEVWQHRLSGRGHQPQSNESTRPRLVQLSPVTLHATGRQALRHSVVVETFRHSIDPPKTQRFLHGVEVRNAISLFPQTRHEPNLCGFLMILGKPRSPLVSRHTHRDFTDSGHASQLLRPILLEPAR